MKKKPTLHDSVRQIGIELIELQRKAHDAGLVRTAAQLNQAQNKLGWEAAYLIGKKP